MGVHKLIWTLVILGYFVCRISSQGLRPRDFNVRQIRENVMYPYDERYRLSGIDELNTQLHHDFDFNFPYFGFNFNYTFITIHGVIIFSRPPARMEFPMKFPIDDWPAKQDPALIAPFYAKAEVGRGESGVQEAETPPGVYMSVYSSIGAQPGPRQQEEIDLKEALRQDIEDGMVGSTDFLPKHVIIITWRNTTFLGSTKPEITNTFQLLMTTDEIRSYIMFNYDRLRWTSSTGAGGTPDGIGGKTAFVGFNAGNGTRAYEYHPYSQQSKTMDLIEFGYINGHPGRHMFRVDEEILQGSCNFEPDKVATLFMSPESGHMLGGTIVNVTGPCFMDKKKQIKIKFFNEEVICPYISRNMATCVTPAIYGVGYIDVSAKTDTAGRFFENKFYIENPMIPTDLVQVDNKIILNSLDAKVLKLRWSWQNLTHDMNQPVSVNLFGYREHAITPELVFITTLAHLIANDGDENIELTSLQSRNDGEPSEFVFGLIQINTTLPPIDSMHEDLVLTPKIWSQPIPLGWYFHNQWIREYGDDWAVKLCDRWDMDDRRLTTFAHNVPRCPCSLEQAQADKGRYAPDVGCDKWGNAECFGNQKVLHCVRSGQPSPDGAGQQCCYGVEGDLVMNTDMKEGGTPSRSHPFGSYPFHESTKVPGLSHWFHDQTAYLACCEWQSEMSASCYHYKWRRASQDCIGYQPPNSSVVFGDPHFITFDNLEYTFNGKGEFSLLRVHHESNDLDVQARFEQIVDLSKNLRLPATLLTSVAAKDNSSKRVEIQLRPSEARWRYRLNVLVEGKRIYFDRPSQKIQSFEGVTVYCPSHIYNQSHIIAMFRSGAGVEVTENEGFMAARVYLPKSFMNATTGLMGNWSNDREDDLTPPPHKNLPPVSPSASVEQIHKDFGIHWMVTQSGEIGIDGTASIFTYENTRDNSFYNNQSFVPNYDREPKWESNASITLDDVDRICGSRANPRNYQCRYDYLITQNKQFAQVTKSNADSFRQMKSNMKTITTCGALETPRHGRKSTNKYTVNTEVKFECEKNYVLEGEPIRWCYLSGEWSWVEFGITRCLPEDEYNARQAGITSGIILGILIPTLIAAACLFCFIVSKSNREPNSRGESHEMQRGQNTAVVVEGEKASSRYTTDA